jgi:hypothetical protein
VPQLNPFTPPEWDSTDVSITRAFFSSPTGKKLLHRLRNDRPDPKVTGGVEAAALSAAAIHGYETAIFNIFDYLVTEVGEQELSDTYPSLDRDEVWGPSLQPAAFRIGAAALNPSVKTPQ